MNHDRCPGVIDLLRSPVGLFDRCSTTRFHPQWGLGGQIMKGKNGELVDLDACVSDLGKYRATVRAISFVSIP